MASTEFGIRIKIYEAKSIYEHDLGINDVYDTKRSSIKKFFAVRFPKRKWSKN